MNYVEILGKKVKVVSKELEGDLIGRFQDEPELQITLCPKLSKKQKERVLLHEMIHAFMFLTGISVLISGELNEAITLSAEYHIEDLIKSKNKYMKENS